LKRRQVNTAGFNKPFDEALPIFSKKKEEDFDKIITEFTQTATNISSSLEKINVFYIFSLVLIIIHFYLDPP
jgi:hypothetical protein